MLQYLLKFSISLAVLYVFYRAVLRPLTFYQCNRFYLLCYAVLSFVIPFINITPWVVKEDEPNNQLINIIPVIGNYTVATAGKVVTPGSSFVQDLTVNQWLLIIFCLGFFVMLARNVYQYMALTRIRSKSVLLNSSDNIHLYQTREPVSPFSFGNAIYFNSSLHTEEELQRIIQHEFVHVKQKHSVDILLGELLCIVNWFNPFAWLIRHAIRQNLEFIADNDVLANGLDKKEYQYLLLKVVGIPQYSIASNFNFSNLKKRIAMMNKMKSARLHLSKFLFVLPLLLVLLLAFRNKINDNVRQKLFVFTGIVYDQNTSEPLPGVFVSDSSSGLSEVTDANGFFKMRIPVGNDSIFRLNYNFKLTGFGSTRYMFMSMKITGERSYADLIFAGIHKQDDTENNNIALNAYHQVPRDNKNQVIADPEYTFVHDKFETYQNRNGLSDRIDALTKSSKKPIWIIDGIPYAIGNGGRAWFNKDEIKASPEFKVWVDGKIMSMNEANSLVNRFEVNGLGAFSGENSVKKYGVHGNLLVLYWKTKDTLPIPPPPPPAIGLSAPTALPANGGLPENVTGISHRININLKSKLKEDIVTVTLKNGIKEVYNFYNADEKTAYIKKYGELPQPPPPPPAASPVPRVPAAMGNAPAIAPTPPVSAIDVMPPVATGANSGEVQNISISENTGKKAGTHSHTAVVTLKNGTVEKYNLDNANEKAVYIKKYGALPGAIPPIAPVPAVPPVDVPTPVVIMNGIQQPDFSLNGNTHLKSLKNAFNPPLYIIDGTEMPADYLNKLDGNDISEIQVWKDKNAVERYGDKGKNGVIEIITKQKKQKNKVSVTADTIHAYFDSFISIGGMTVNGNESFINGSFSFEIKTKTPLVIVDGNEIWGCTSYKAEKGKYRMLTLNAKQGIAKYGDKAKYGALEISHLNNEKDKNNSMKKINSTATVPATATNLTDKYFYNPFSTLHC